MAAVLLVAGGCARAPEDATTVAPGPDRTIGTSIDTASAPDATAPPTSDDSWLTYRDAATGLRLSYPPDATIEPSGDPTVGVMISGPLVDGERWPSFLVRFPADRPEFRPPDGVDLVTWLEEHALLDVEMGIPPAEARQPDAIVAGTTAVHTRFERSPHSYAYDKYWFVHRGQLFQVIIGHVGGREDWALYRRFLDGIAFDA